MDWPHGLPTWQGCHPRLAYCQGRESATLSESSAAGPPGHGSPGNGPPDRRTAGQRAAGPPGHGPTDRRATGRRTAGRTAGPRAAGLPGHGPPDRRATGRRTAGPNSRIRVSAMVSRDSDDRPYFDSDPDSRRDSESESRVTVPCGPARRAGHSLANPFSFKSVGGS